MKSDSKRSRISASPALFYIELVNMVLRAEMKIPDPIRNLLRFGSQGSRLRQRENFMLKLIFERLPEKLHADFRKVIFEKAGQYPYDLSDGLERKIWSISSHHSIKTPIREALVKQAVVGHVACMIAGNETEEGEGWSREIWSAFEAQNPIEDDGALYVFCQYLIDQIRPSENSPLYDSNRSLTVGR